MVAGALAVIGALGTFVGLTTTSIVKVIKAVSEARAERERISEEERERLRAEERERLRAEWASLPTASLDPATRESAASAPRPRRKGTR